MISFENDYNAGCHPQVLEALVETNLEKLTGYGNDPYCLSAAEKIKQACGIDSAEVYFLVGGTQTNAVVIDALLKSFHGVIATTSAHIATHEAGAIEHTGHKVLTLPEHQGKLDVNEVAQFIKNFYDDDNHEHEVAPGMVYISHPTEYGTLYTKQELKDLATLCEVHDLPLFIDGARLGYGLMSPDTDVTLHDIATYSDVFYIGGTKVGALCGEAIVFTKNNMPKHFNTFVKQHGAMLAKGRLLGVQFDTLFTNNLYFEISRHAMTMAGQLRQLLLAKGYELYIDSPTNQQYIVLANQVMDELKNHLAFSFWEKIDEDHTAVRFVTSWATEQSDLDALEKYLPQA